MSNQDNYVLNIFQRHLSDSDLQSSPKDKSSKGELKSELKKTQEELMSVKLREAAALSHLKDTKQRVMELETSVSAVTVTVDPFTRQ